MSFMTFKRPGFTIYRDHRGIALLLVMAVVFVVIASITVSAGLVIGNLDALRSRFDLTQSEASLQAAGERIRGYIRMDNGVFDGCQVGDCLSASGGSCTSCGSGDADYSSGDITYRATLKGLLAPDASTPGYAIFGIDAYLKNRHVRQSDHFCLNTCTSAGHNCGDDGCGGSCGSCGPSETCGGGGTPGICDTGNCSDISIECGGACIEGANCGGGVLIDAAQRIVVSQSGCTEDGSDCVGGTDSIERAWDDSGTSDNTAAENEADGRANITVLNPTVNTQYAAAAYCESLAYGGYDWYLPAKDELDQIYVQKVAGSVTGLAAEIYLSSTDDNGSTDSEWTQDMDSGSSSVGKKVTARFVRCVRRF